MNYEESPDSPDSPEQPEENNWSGESATQNDNTLQSSSSIAGVSDSQLEKIHDETASQDGGAIQSNAVTLSNDGENRPDETGCIEESAGGNDGGATDQDSTSGGAVKTSNDVSGAALVAEMPPVTAAAERTIEAAEFDEMFSNALSAISGVRLSEDGKKRMDEQRVRDGNDPDCAEYEQLGLPGLMIVQSDLFPIRRKTVFVYSLTMEEFSHPHIVDIMAHCREFKVSFVQHPPEETTTKSSWKGCMVFHMHTVNDADEAVALIHDMRPDLNVRILKTNENPYRIIELWRGDFTLATDDSSTVEVDRLLVVNNLAPGATEAKLRNLFSDALEVVFPLDKNSGKRKSSAVKDFAYLTFGSRRHMEEAYDKYMSKVINYDGHMLRIYKYKPPKNIPVGFLRLQERYRLLQLLQRFIGVEAKLQPLHIQKRLTWAISYLSSVIKSDAEARKCLGLAVYTLDELQHLLAIQRPPAGEHVPAVDLLNMLNIEREGLRESRAARTASNNSVDEKSSERHKSNEESDSTKTKVESGAKFPGGRSKDPAGRLSALAGQSAPFESSQRLFRRRLAVIEGQIPRKRLRPAVDPKTGGGRSRSKDDFHRAERYGRGGSHGRSLHFRSSATSGTSSYCTNFLPRKFGEYRVWRSRFASTRSTRR